MAGEWHIERLVPVVHDEVRWKSVGTFSDGSPYRDHRPVCEQTMREELWSYQLHFPEQIVRLRRPDNSIIEPPPNENAPQTNYRRPAPNPSLWGRDAMVSRGIP